MSGTRDYGRIFEETREKKEDERKVDIDSHFLKRKCTPEVKGRNKERGKDKIPKMGGFFFEKFPAI